MVKYYRVILVIVLIISLLLLGFESIGALTGKATVSTPSEVSVISFIAMTFSTDLQDGIVFEEINFLPAENVSADKNYNSTNETEYYVLVSSNSNSEMDLCIRAGGDLLNPSLDAIGIGNETYSHSLLSNVSLPSLSEDTSLTLSYVPSGNNIPLGGKNNLRFWLDVPAGQAPGTYNNSIYFKGMRSGDGC